MAGVLEGLRIVELAGLGPAPFAAMMLADHGGEVIRVHALRPRRGVRTVDTEADVLARGRRSIAVDLKRAEGRDLVLDLIGRADGVIEGFRPGVMERLGLGPDVCLQRNPRLAYGRMTGWGQTGALAARAGHDINYIALSGALSGIGPAERPMPPLNLLGDFGGGGMLLAFGMLAAVMQARTTGRGQVVDAAMVDGSALLSAMIYGFRAAGAWSDQREANLLDGGAYFYGTYRCADDRFVAVGAIEPQFHAQLLAGLELDPQSFNQGDEARWPDARRRIGEVFAAKTRDHWVSVFEGTDACVSPVLDWAEAPEHQHNRGREVFVKVGGIAQPAPAPRFSATPSPPPTLAGLPDAGSGELLAGWGIETERTSALLSAGVIGEWPDASQG